VTADPADRASGGNGPDQPEAAQETAAVRRLVDRARDRGDQVVVFAATVANASEIVAGRGGNTLAAMIIALAERAANPDTSCELLTVSGFGIVGTVTVSPGEQDQAISQVADQLAGLVNVNGELLWPAVTLAAWSLEPTDSIELALRRVRATVLDAMHTSPGSVRWAVSGSTTSHGPDELALARDLALALTSETDQVSLVFQPVCELDGGGIVGAEALVRWQHPVHGMVPAQSMVRLAERTGLIRQLGTLVLDRALAETLQARESYGPGFRMHVNASPFELREPGYVDSVSAALARHGVPPSSLLLELTETALMTSETNLISVLADLRAAGVEIGIDDFGTGYSSIARLHRLPVDTVKVDRSLIADIGTSSVEFDLVRAVFKLLETAGVQVVAEGVETAVQVAHLRALGCRLGQGLLLGHPAPAAVPA
jgi:EAL domain-containing protein (putative c-di-GMP-specific phosphodiesterase class I)